MEFKMSAFIKRVSISISVAVGVTVSAPLCASANADTLHHRRARHHVVIPPGVASSFASVPGGTYAPHPSAFPYNDAPSYNDPSKFGGSTALPIQN
jgi:hypothetical protein